MIGTLREMLLLLHAGRQAFSVVQCERDVERARQDLALALAARDRALAELRINEAPPRVLPAFLRAGYDAARDPYPLHIRPELVVIDGERTERINPRRKNRS